jgi:hypothetical protein
MKFTADLEVNQDQVRQTYGIEIRKYLTQEAGKSVGIINQPEPHFFFHRPLNAIFAACFPGGFVIDGFEEPRWPTASPGNNSKNPFSWAKRPEIPAAIIVRCRPRSSV